MFIKNKKKILENNKGFTLIEILVSIVILSIIIVTFLSFFSQALFYSVKEEDKLTGINIAERIMFNVKQSDDIIDLLFLNEYVCGQNPLNINNSFSGDVDLEYKDDVNLFYYEVNNKEYYLDIIICSTPEERDLFLSRTHIKIYQSVGTNPKGKIVYDTFHYINLNDYE
ncbi:prepilin-type N-terminal cleavage/methylation domain-containing protein [Bacillus sp. FJAT-45066]|uniref:prepilin-type N-terminal cleavage/methylation domain-containing protein n=1 Tax=Bacillus sp. FJAT-45066 TaxID=2011010 RepID=UPI000BB75FBF|nr:prepilin-type N-terminal cleavage/methylation domain-containing protein [Bacillus sp. FJAT-45066]